MKKAILFLSVCFYQQAFAQWVKINGLDTCSINSVAVDKNNGTIYAVASQGNTFIGLFSQSNLSDPWVKIFKGLGSVVVNKIEITPGGTLYLATTNGVYVVANNDTCKSINEGLPNNFGTFPSVNALTSIDSFLYIGTNYGIFRTLTSGTINWQNFSQNLPTGISPNRILKYQNYLVASYSNNVYATAINISNWTGMNSISDGQGSFPPTINDMAVGDSTIYLAVEGAWSNAYKSINDSLKFSPCAATSDLTAYSAYARDNNFWIGTFYGGIYKGSNNGNDLSRSNPNLPAWATVKSITQYGSALLVGTEYYTYQNGSGGLYYLENIILATFNTNLRANQQGEFVKIVWERQHEWEVEGFELEKYDYITNQFKTIKTYLATQNNYDYNDYDINNSNESILYRLKILNVSGEINYSQTIYVKTENTKTLVFPNPTTSKLNLHLPGSGTLQKYTLRLYTSSGILRVKKNDITQNKFSIDLSTLPKGVYFLKIESAKYSYSKKIILQ